jgi:N-acetylmuramoyl-L-alanine amidase
VKYSLLSLLALVIVLLTACNGIDKNRDIIVLDAGHGGHDKGASVNSEFEKDVVLQVTKKTKEALENKGYRVYMTRGRDTFLTLSQRTKLADKLDAKAFLSIHANALPSRKHAEHVNGIETYFLQKTRDAKSQRIAARENRAVLQGTDRLSQNVIVDSVLNGPKIIESNKLAIDVQRQMVRSARSLYSDVKDGGVRPAPFYVLVGASRPSILIELGYMTHSQERKRLFSKRYQSKLAKGIAEGVDRYLETRKKELGF